MKAWITVLNDETDNNDECKKLEDDADLSNEMEVPIDAFVTGRDVLPMITNETKKAAATMVTDSVSNTVEDTVADVIQVPYISAKGVINAPLFHLVEEALIDVVQKGCLNTLLIRNMDKLAESDHYMDAIAHRMADSSALTNHVAQFLKGHMKKRTNECRLELMVERQVRIERLVQ